MADHDLAAELQGYRNELAHCQAAGKGERAAAVREQIERVEGEVRGRAEALEGAADGHDQAGQDVLAAQARVDARRFRALLGDGDGDGDGGQGRRPARRGAGRGRKEDTADRTPREKA